MGYELDWSLFFSVLLLQNNLFDGMKMALVIVFSVWIVSLIFGFLFAEIKSITPPHIKFLPNFVLWVFKCSPIIVLLFYFYFYIGHLIETKLPQLVFIVFAMSFWGIANITTLFYQCRQYNMQRSSSQSSVIGTCVFLPFAIRFLTNIIVRSPFVIIIYTDDFLGMIRQLIVTNYYQYGEILSATLIVYLILAGIPTIIAYSLGRVLKVPKQLFSENPI